MTQKIDLQEQIEAYLQAFEARDLSHCIVFFDDDACIYFMSEVYRGKERIEKWHKDRFAADLRIVGVKGMTIEENKVRIRGSIVSKRIRAWPAKSFSVIITASFEQGKIKEIKFGLGAIQTA